MALAECRVSNLIENVRNCSTPVLERLLCQVELLGQERVILAITVFTSLDSKVEFARLTVIGVDQNLHASRTFTAWFHRPLNTHVTQHYQNKELLTWTQRFSIIATLATQQLDFPELSV